MEKTITTIQITLPEAAEISSLLSRYAAEHRITGEIEEAHRAMEIIRLFDRLRRGNCRYPLIDSMDVQVSPGRLDA